METTKNKLIKNCKILELTLPVSYKEIKSQYRILIKKWHPDKSNKNFEKNNKKIDEIKNAYEYLKNYIMNYKFNFSENKNINNISKEEWWFNKFGNDPVWGNNK